MWDIETSRREELEGERGEEEKVVEFARGS